MCQDICNGALLRATSTLHVPCFCTKRASKLTMACWACRQHGNLPPWLLVQVDACQSNASSDGAWQDLSPSEQEQLEPLPDGQQVMDLLQKHR